MRHPAGETGFVLGLAADPQAPETFYLATQNGFFRSRDSGLSWEKVNPDPLGRQVRPDASSSPATLLALGGKGILSSSDGGQSWAEVTGTQAWFDGAADILVGVDSRAAADTAVYVATACCAVSPNDFPTDFLTWRSADSGGEFHEITDQVGFAHSMAFDNGAPRTLYLASDLGIFRSQDDGASWQPVDGVGLPQGVPFRALATDPRSEPALLIAGGDSGEAFVSADRGASWSAAGHTPGRILEIAVDPAFNRSIRYARSNAGLFADFGNDSEWLALRRISHQDSLTFLAMSATSQHNPAALFAVVNNQVEHYQPEYRYLPQVGEGVTGDGRFQTSLLINNAAGESFIYLEFFSPSGQALELDLGERGTASSLCSQLPRGQSQDLETLAGPELRVGYARLLAGAGVGATAVFTRSDVPSSQVLYEAGVPLAGVLSDFSIPVDSRGIRDSGVALVNASSGEAHLVLRLYDELFQLIAAEEIELAPFAQLARFVSELFPEAQEQAREMRGTMTVQSDQPLAAVTLRQNEDPSSSFPESVPVLTTFPVIAARPESGNEHQPSRRFPMDH